MTMLFSSEWRKQRILVWRIFFRRSRIDFAGNCFEARRGGGPDNG